MSRNDKTEIRVASRHCWPPIDDGNTFQCQHSQQLSKILDSMFPQDYIKSRHQPPQSVCSLLNLRTLYFGPSNERDDSEEIFLEVSTEPASRNQVCALKEELEASMLAHQAKRTGLCPIRRAIYDQLFDELIRQVTVSCVEQGQLLYKIRNELRHTLDYYHRAYESGVMYGLSKSIDAELAIESDRQELEDEKNRLVATNLQDGAVDDLETKNKLEAADRMREYFEKQLAEKERIIERQRTMIEAISLKATVAIEGPE